jgi:anaerobic carbon-monoxide dehydrogenase iron sulfur subunit
MSGKTFVVIPEKCTGCKSCELACAYAHMADGQPGTPRINTYTIKPPMIEGIQITCLQCDTAACVEACPAFALQRNLETGAIEINLDRCINCHACYAACSFGNIVLDPNNRVAKCDLCGGAPKCVPFCPTGALQYI